ncbi:OLC1v1036531C1 [Oldenlandia corymbosa var. corymbosa]|uniref:OLC1v1036531C1 n=1 Tax=Oldenlandia corymbosa var. corymbosa TaxID=529605 RepID=A0AAV1CYS7_OLDCO|nr:OLC1v1036531C1 [Oldenlandia corymbosa var. corymbosa]
MASVEVRRVSREDIQLNLIERCLQLYMNQKEVVNVLLQQAKIEPGFTELVWQKLEEENQEFFRAYHLRLIVKDQIVRFNELLERQNQLMHHICSSEFSNGSQIPMRQLTVPHSLDHTLAIEQSTVAHSLEHIDSPLKRETVDPDLNSNLHDGYSLQQYTPAMDLTTHTGRIEASSNIPFCQNSNIRIIQGMNGQMLKQEAVYTGNNAVAYNANVNAFDARRTIGDVPVSPYNGVGHHSQPLNRSYADTETPAFGSLSQIPRNFSLSDLTSGYSNEELERYSREESIEAQMAFITGLGPLIDKFHQIGATRNRLNLYARLKSGLLNDIQTSVDAINLYKQMVRMTPPPNDVAFSQLLVRVVKLKHYSLAISLYRNMTALGFPVSDYILNTVIHCYCLVNKVDFGFSVLGGFFKRGIVPGVCTFGTLLKGLFKETRILQAQELFKKIIYEKLCDPGVVMYGTVIDGLCKVGNTTKALEFLRDMERTRVEPDIMYSVIIDSLCKDNMVDEAVLLLLEMIKKGIAPDVVTCTCLIKGLSNIGKWAEAKNLFKGMVDLGIAPNTYTFNILIDALCKEGKVKEAEHFLLMMTQHGQNPDVVTYSSLIEGCCLQGRINKARKFFDTMVESGIVPDMLSYSMLINGHFKRSQVDQAMQLFRELFRKGFTPNVSVYTTVLQGLFRAGKFVTARDVFIEMQSLFSIPPDFHTYCVLLYGLVESGSVDEALKFLHKLEADEVKLHTGKNHSELYLNEACPCKISSHLTQVQPYWWIHCGGHSSQLGEIKYSLQMLSSLVQRLSLEKELEVSIAANTEAAVAGKKMICLVLKCSFDTVEWLKIILFRFVINVDFSTIDLSMPKYGFLYNGFSEIQPSLP